MTQLRHYTVSTTEAEALKEMIFKRARERAEAFSNDVNENYTSSMQNDVMELARNSFVAAKNPFSQIKEASIKEVTEQNDIGFAQRKNDVKTRINNSSQESQAVISAAQVQSAMNEARNELTSKSSFMGALNFLNAQATISLINKKNKSFEALA